MENKRFRVFTYMKFMSLVTCIFSKIVASQDSLETYIVHVKLPNGQAFNEPEDLERWYLSFLPATASSANEQSRMVYSYRSVVTGFAARLSPEEAKAMKTKDGFVSARPQRVLALHTTHTPNFLGLHQNSGFWEGSNYGKGVIIGLFDTGITPNHPSFSDEGVPPPPAKWKGKCELDGNACNNKLIGARNFVRSGGYPVDKGGHGTLTSSIAGGNHVKDANVFGNAFGTASGMAPLAHLAMYRACSEIGCLESDTLAAMDAAVEDGVDIMSISIGTAPFFDDGPALGAFGAMQMGIFNEAPWILTVGASTIDRRIEATALLGNKDELDGESVFQPKEFPPTLLPLVYPGINGDRNTSWCLEGTLNNTDVKGKVVLCERGGGIGRTAKGQIVKDAGGAAMIIANQEPDGHVNPSRANDPGLVYDIQPNDYVPYLCGLGYTDAQVGVVARRKVSCSRETSIAEAQLNYPSFSITLGPTSQTYTRTVTNVGDAISSYAVEIFPPPGVRVRIIPDKLSFSEMNQRMSYEVTFIRSTKHVNTPFVQGYLKWISAKHFVRSPISVKFM
ncbi:LOW QUALITY PROTEIN: hypothetical protein RJ639_003781 [Escallonia herrerae]|uniref:Subtilisin-like protease n=1 Tax=Escallonia herrerae TaxID=1293975 RepID=A0AA88W4S3_9ASTE|nr:LOW QUALITY PROTEIN: hypothetical protein RJ639_003781 [Escallonia herrerae]